MPEDLLQGRAAASSPVRGWGEGWWVVGGGGVGLRPGHGLQIPREDAEGGVGAPSALSCPAVVWHFTK